MSPLIKITWIKNNDKERFKKTWKFLSIKSYIIQQLVDGYVIDYSLASATGLLNIHKKTWERKTSCGGNTRPCLVYPPKQK